MSEEQTEPIVNVIIDTIGPEFATDFALAQAEIEGAKKDAENPHFKSKYADLASVWEACRKALTSHGFSVIQMPHGTGADAVVTTMLLHKSGQRISSTLTLYGKDSSPQAVCAAITYARRYALAAMAGVAPEDDDGETAQSAWKEGKKAAGEVAKEKITTLKKTPPVEKSTTALPTIESSQTLDEFQYNLDLALDLFPKIDKFKRLDLWKALKDCLKEMTKSDKEYVALLRTCCPIGKDGFPHANLFTDLKTEMAAFEDMWKAAWEINERNKLIQAEAANV